MKKRSFLTLGFATIWMSGVCFGSDMTISLLFQNLRVRPL